MSKQTKNVKAQRVELRKAVSELGEVRRALDEAYGQFDRVTDPVVMDACIFEISALKSRYSCAVRNVKALYL